MHADVGSVALSRHRGDAMVSTAALDKRHFHSTHSMRLDVPSQRAGIAEAPLADGARERLLPCVGSGVDGECAHLDEPLRAALASERSVWGQQKGQLSDRVHVS